MSTENIEVEGDSLQEALSKAAALLGCERDAVDFEYDREHLAAGASTVKIYARKMDEQQLADARAKRAAEANRSSAPRSDRGGYDRPRDDRGPPRDRGPRRDDRGPPRGGDRRGPPRDGDRGPPRGDGDRAGFRSDGPRGPRGDRPRPEKDPVRDEALRERARGVAQRVLSGEGPLSIDDLNSYERHLVHTVIAETGGLTSQSLGEGLRKNVQIALASPTI